ncbi:MAG: lysophospholipid acyltransferase family protein, partial [Candidatus Hodarchaeales archaeon]
KGVENVPHEGVGTIISPNHQSLIDPFVMGVWLKKRRFALHFMSSKNYMSKAIFRWVKLAGAFPVDQRKGKAGKALQYSKELLLDGSAVIIFPEGERSWSKGNIQRGFPGVGYLAYDTHAVVIPALILGTANALPRYSLLPRVNCKFYIEFGKPLKLDQYYEKSRSRQTAQEIANKVMNAIKKMKLDYLKRIKEPAKPETRESDSDIANLFDTFLKSLDSR